MRSLIVFVVLSLGCVNVNAQFRDDIRLHTGERMPFDEMHFQEFLEVEGDKLYTMGSDDKNFYRNKEGQEFYFSTYDISKEGTFNLIDRVIIPAQEYKGQETRYFKSFANSSGFHLVTECFHKKAKMKYLLLQSVSRGGKISEITKLSSMSCEKEGERAFLIRLSENQEKLLVYADISAEADNQIPEIWVYDSDFESFWTVEVPEGLKLKSAFHPTALEIGDDGRVLLLGYQTKVRMFNGNTEVVSQYALIQHNEREPVSVLPLKSDSNLVHHLTMNVTPEGMIKLVGFISENGKVTPDGYLYATVDPKEMKLVDEVWERFDKEVIAQFPGGHETSAYQHYQYWTTGGMGGAQKRLDYFEAIEFRYWDDGATTVVAERQWGSEYQNYSYNYALNFDELLVMHFDANGKIKWTRMVPKFQSMGVKTRGLGSIYVQQHDNRLHIIYNDYTANISSVQAKAEDPVRSLRGAWMGAKAAVVAATIDTEGEISYSKVHDAEEENTLLLPWSVMEVDAYQNLGVMITLGANKIQMMQMDFD